MVYITPAKYNEVNDYLEKYLPHWSIPFNLCTRSMMRSFETGLLREKTKGEKGKRRPNRVIPLYVYKNELGLATVEFKGKHGVPRKVETPYTEDEITQWYNEEAPRHEQVAYRTLLRRRGLGTHDGRRTGIINFTLLHSHMGWDFQQELLSRTGHKSPIELQPYFREYITVKNMLKEQDFLEISEMMKHMPIKHTQDLFK